MGLTRSCHVERFFSEVFPSASSSSSTSSLLLLLLPLGFQYERKLRTSNPGCDLSSNPKKT
jgi:hypothetical protein